MKNRVEFKLGEGRYLMDIANKLIVPQPSENEICDETDDYFKKRDELLQKHDVEDYADFVTKRIEKRITPQMIERQIANMVQLVFEVTEDCNLNCGYCGYGEFYGDFTARHKLHMPFEMAKTVIDYLIPYWESEKHTSFKREINISFYGGEPLMNMTLIRKIIDYTEHLHFKYSKPVYSMTTNAMLLNKHMDYLVEKNFRLLLSLDGDSANNSYRVTQGGHSSFDTVYRNIKNLREKYPEYFDGMVSFNAVVHDRNSAGEVIGFISDNFGKIPFLSELNTNGIKENMLDKFNRTFKNVATSLEEVKDQEELESKMKNTYPKNSSLVRFLHQYSGNVYKSYNSLFCEQKAQQFIPTGTCFPFSKRLFLTVGGKILPCERIGHQYCLGHVSENGVSLSPENIADKYNRYFDKLLKYCSKCYITEHCIQCIFNIKDLDGNPVCRGYMPESKFGDFVAGKLRFLQEKPERYKSLMTEVLVQ